MARTRQETDELVLALVEWAADDPDAALVVATVNDGTQESGALITLGHAGCTVVSAMATVAELLDLAEELARTEFAPGQAEKCLERIRAGRIALGLLGAETIQ